MAQNQKHTQKPLFRMETTGKERYAPVGNICLFSSAQS